jgi:hypothetical protein
MPLKWLAKSEAEKKVQFGDQGYESGLTRSKNGHKTQRKEEH